MENIYTIKCHESIDIAPQLQAVRVPGGWIYRFWDNEKSDYYPNAVFVPYDDQFQDYFNKLERNEDDDW